MKKICSTIAVLAISSLALLSSCSKHSDNPITPASPEAVVSLNENTNKTGSDSLFVKRDKTSAVIQVNGVSKTSTDMKRIYVYKLTTTSSAGAYITYNSSGFTKDVNDNYYYDIPSDQKNNATLTLNIPLNGSNTTAISDEYYFAFTDGTPFGGPTNTTGLLLGAARIFIAYGLLNETTGNRINNIQGPNSGAFNLITLTNKSATDPAIDKDMIDADATTALWDKSFNSSSGTLFAKLPKNFDYTNATDISIKAAYASSNQINTQTGIVVGDMYVANVRGTNTSYVLIKVTFISEETNGTGDGNNNEYMEFSVKK